MTIGLKITVGIAGASLVGLIAAIIESAHPSLALTNAAACCIGALLLAAMALAGR